MDRLLNLEIFATVVEKGGFAAAAKALDLSPASVTEHVQALEQRLKTKLLNRTTRRIALTDEGHAYFKHCQQILASIEEADGMLAAQRESPKGLLRVQAPPMLCTRILFPELPAFLQRYPDLRLEFTLNAGFPDLLQDNLDMALTIAIEPRPGVVFRPLGMVRIRTCASPEYLARRGVPLTPDDLDRHDTIGVRAAPDVFLSSFRFQRDGKPFSRDYRCRVIADSGDAQRMLALANVGIFQGGHYAVVDLLQQGRLVEVLADWSWSGPPLGVVHLPNRFLSPKMQVFLDFARKALGDRIDPYDPAWAMVAESG